MFSKSVTYLRFVMAIMVVLIHAPFLLQESAVWNENIDSAAWIVLSRVICQLAVPTFFLVSGYYFFSGFNTWDWSKYADKLKKRTKTVLLPYFIWNSLFIIPHLFFVGIFNSIDLLAFFSHNGWLRIYWDCQNSDVVKISNILGVNMGVGSPIDGPLWFIRDLMVVFILSPFVYFIVSKLKVYVLILVGVCYIFNIWLPFSGFSSTSMFFFMIGGWLMIEKKDPLAEFKKIRMISIIGAMMFLILSTLLYNIDACWYDICMRTFRVFAIPLVFITTAYFLQKEMIQVNESLSRCSFFIFASHYYFSFRVQEHLISILHLNFIDKTPFTKYLIVSLFSVLILVSIKKMIDIFFPKTSLLLNGNR